MNIIRTACAAALIAMPTLPLTHSAATAAEGVEVAACVVGVRWDDTLNVRSGPSTRFRIIFALPPDACGVRVNWNSCQGNWCRIVFRGRGGWVNTRFLG